MAIHPNATADVKADLYATIPSDGTIITLLGNITRGDILPVDYLYDGSSSAADNYPDVIRPTLQTGNGRHLRILFQQYQADWTETDSTKPSFVNNKPGVTFLIPTGSIIMWGTDTAPTGWSLCDGSAISRTTYAALFAVIGTNYGLGDGSTTFNVPDMRQRFPLGKSSSGTGNTLGNTGGTIDHLHTVDPPSTTSSAPSATVTGIALLGIAGAASDTHTHSVDIASLNSGTANPPYVVVNYIIKQ